jgi:DNA-binding transcriptional MerR regulator
MGDPGSPPPKQVPQGLAPDSGAHRGPLRIHVVAELTGVPEPTLRAWERRYGIPTPERTAAGYRLYGPHDLEQVREMRRLCDAGMAASEAARLLLSGGDGAEAQARLDPYAVFAEALMDAVTRFDDAGLDRQLRRLLLLGSTTTLLDRVLVPVLREIGQRWHRGEISVAQEHLASQRLGTLLRDLLQLSPGSESHSRALLACFADDEHELGLLGTAMRFSGWGLRPVFLGARTPPGAVRSAIEAISPALVALSVTITPERARARELVDDYASACAAVPWIVGGVGAGAIADMIRTRGGEVEPEDPSALRGVLRTMLERGAAKPPPATKPRRKKP